MTTGGVGPAGVRPTLAVLLRTWRQRALLTQEQLAGRAGLAVRTIRRLETDHRSRPHGESLQLLAGALGLGDSERAILVAAAQERSPAGSEPRELPVDVAGFTGRTQQLREMDALLNRGAAPITMVITAIAGTAGVGKTALAVHWAHRVAPRFPDGQLYVNLRGFDPDRAPTEPAAAVVRFLGALGVSPQRLPADAEAQIALYRSLMAGRRMLVVLDNARDAAQVRPLLPAAPGCLTVVTSRNQLIGLVAAEGAHPLTLDLMSTVEAHELLASRLGAHRVTEDPAAVGDIITLCARLPLALAVAAARAAYHPDQSLADLTAEMRSASDRLTAFDTRDPGTDVRTAFSWSYHRLSPHAAGLFRLLGLHPGPDVSAPAAASLAGIPPQQARPLLTELTDAHLVSEHTAGRYALHDLLRAYATEQAHAIDIDSQRRAATRRVLDHYLHTARAADRLLNPIRDPITLPPHQPGVTPEHHPDHARALAWFTAEHPVLIAAVDHAAANGHDTHTWQLAWTLANFLNRQGHWYDWAATERVGLAAAQRSGDREAETSAHRFLANAYTLLGNHDDADTHLRHALDLSSAVGDAVGQAHTHHGLARLRDLQGRYTEALHHAQQALALHRATGHRNGQANALSTVGWYLAQLGDHRQALAYCQRALAMHQELGNHHGQAATWDSLAYIHHHLGDHAQAITGYQRALDLYHDLGDRYAEAATTARLGDTHHTAGDPHAARDAWRRALTLLEELDNPDADHIRTKLAAG